MARFSTHSALLGGLNRRALRRHHSRVFSLGILFLLVLATSAHATTFYPGFGSGATVEVVQWDSDPFVTLTTPGAGLANLTFDGTSFYSAFVDRFYSAFVDRLVGELPNDLISLLDLRNRTTPIFSPVLPAEFDDLHAAELARAGVPMNVIQRQPGHEKRHDSRPQVLVEP